MAILRTYSVGFYFADDHTFAFGDTIVAADTDAAEKQALDEWGTIHENGRDVYVGTVMPFGKPGG